MYFPEGCEAKWTINVTFGVNRFFGSKSKYLERTLVKKYDVPDFLAILTEILQLYPPMSGIRERFSIETVHRLLKMLIYCPRL
jgi:hypothetical protein